MLRPSWKILDHPAVWQTAQTVAGRYTVRAYRRALAELLRLRSDEAVLDVGCGTGEYSRLLNYRRYLGVDFNDRYIQSASQRFGNDDRVRFLSMDVADVPKLNLNFDAAFCVGVTHHLSDDELRKLVTDVLRSVSVRFVIVDLVLPPVWKNPLSHSLIRMDRGRHGRPKEKLVEILRESGHEIEAISDTFGFPHQVVGISIRK
jgi:SAM-dependent methyltransferase